MENNVITVTEFNQLINQTLLFAYPEVMVEGEVASFKVNQNRWVFFDLKDQESVVSCFIPLYQLKVKIEDGMLIRVVATPSLTRWGKFSLTVKQVELAGEGSVKRAFEILKAQFEKEGLFAVERKRILEEIPRNIVLITSKQAAAYNDFITVLNDRWQGVNIDHIQVQVQGAEAINQIVDAVEFANQQNDKYEVLVLIRGGGSAEDLQAFNSEEVVRAIYASKIPTIVGVGHEDDISLAELAADVRAATPTDAARRLVPDKSEILNKIKHLISLQRQILSKNIHKNKILINKFYYSVDLYLGSIAHLVAEISHRNQTAIENLIKQRKTCLQHLSQLLKSFDPMAVLSRGYSITRVKKKIITDARQVKSGDTVMVQLNRGFLKFKTYNLKKGKENHEQSQIRFGI